MSIPLALSAADLKAMPRKTLKVVNPHDKKTEVYEGVLVSEFFSKAGAPMGRQLRGAMMTTYVLAEASDGYRVIFSMAELDSDFADSDAIVADTLDGATLGPNEGPFKLVVPHDKRPARWVRMLQSLTVSQIPNGGRLGSWNRGDYFPFFSSSCWRRFSTSGFSRLCDSSS